jgi:hypothetical protein
MSVQHLPVPATVTRPASEETVARLVTADLSAHGHQDLLSLLALPVTLPGLSGAAFQSHTARTLAAIREASSP